MNYLSIMTSLLYYRIPLVLFLLLFVAGMRPIYARSTPDNINFSRVGIEEGLSQLSVMAIYQDQLGNMWFGTREGLNIYNGSSTKTLHPRGDSPNSLSGNLIKAIEGDSKGNVFIHTQNGIDEYDIRTGALHPRVKMQVNAMCIANDTIYYAKKNGVFRVEDGTVQLVGELDIDTEITALRPASGNRLVVGTIASGVYSMKLSGNSTQILTPNSRVASLFEDSKGNIWVSTWENGLFKIEKGGGITRYTRNPGNPAGGLSSDFVRVVQEDDNGDFWIGTMEGLDKLDNETQLFYHYNSEVHDDKSLSNESVWSLFKDKYGNIWVGTYFGGANYFHPQSTGYTFHNLGKGVFATRPFPIISEIIPIADHTVLLCTEGNGVIVYDTEDRTYTDIPGLRNENIKSAYYDETSNKLYLGLHLGGLSVIDLATRQLTSYREIRPELNQSNIVRKILPYRGNYLIATHNGLYLFNEDNASFEIFSEALHQHVTYFVDLAVDKHDNLWIASRGVYKHNLHTGETKPFFHDPANPSSLSNNNAIKMFIDSSDRLWIGTSGGGINLFDYDRATFSRFTSENSGLRNNYVSNIAESPLGFLYVTTTRGLSYFHPESDSDIHSPSHDELSLNSLFNGGITIQDNGRVYVAGMNGMVSFNERDILDDVKPLTLHFTSLMVNNREVLPGDETGLITTTLPYADDLTFNHKQSILRFEFASDHIVTQNRYQYIYRVRGLSNDWIPLQDGRNEINLMNLDAGKYTLELMAISPRTKEEMGNTRVTFRVTPPFYLSTTAYFLYILTGVLLIVLYVRYERYKIRLESSLEFEKKEKAHIEEVNQSKLRFFTNISHEFRTPLTLITSQVDMLMQNDKLPTALVASISGIGRNAALMKSLINELLDFRKIDNEKIKVKVGEYNIVLFLREIYTPFEEHARQKQIEYSYEPSEEEILVWFDPNQLQKVISNLLSNAFKFTPAGGKITVQVTKGEHDTHVVVEDTGIGISPENKERVFDRFFQADNEGGDTLASPGTGLGLALTKSIVEAHHGNITLDSEVDKGSRFEVTLLNGAAHFSPSEKREAADPNELSIQKINTYLPEQGANHVPATDENEKRNRILIVEDNEELLAVLKTLFEPIYDVITATNGEEGLTKTIEQQPHIVLSDLMMPVMSGSEMCMRIKTNFAVCHIPVVLLTAQTAAESNIESFNMGADDYITKPFDIPVLIARCNNLVNGRKILQERFAKSTSFNSSTMASNEMDREFLEKASQVIEKNIDNPDFDVNTFSREMNLGRTSLFNKIKGITGQTPNEFIITLKMKKATFLLSNHPEYNISDITYRLGFNSPKYFSTCFKAQFGITPSEYRSTGIID